MSKKRYEYTHAESDQLDAIAPAIEKLGREGWELVSVVFDSKETKYVAFLKKKVRLGKSHERDE